MRRLFVAVAGVIAVSAAALLLVSAGSAARGGLAVARLGSAAANKIVARGVARRELEAFIPPTGAVLTSPGLGVGTRSEAGTVLQDVIDYYRVWRAPGDPQSLIESYSTHPPAGFTAPSYGYGSTRNGTTYWEVSLTLRRLPAGVYQQALNLYATPAKGGGMRLRLDSWAAWLVPRPGWERVPAGVHALAVSEQPNVTIEKTFPVATVTARTKVRQLIAFVDKLPIVQPGGGFISCPEGGWPFDLDFLRAPNARPVARTAEDACYGMAFARGGRKGPGLAEQVELPSVLWRMRILPRCQSSQLRGSATKPQTFGSRGADLQVNLNDVSGRVCGLSGNPKMTLFSASGQRLPTHPRYSSELRDLNVAAPTAPADFFLSWSRPSRSCKAPRAARLDLTILHSSTPLPIRIGSARHPVAPCGGRISLGPGL
jgi:hypothetical protein